jgi:DNA invertase Pin-like site-specific DNA recombinase
VVTRLGRDPRDVLNLIYECEQREAFVTVLRPHVSTRGEMGQIVLNCARHGCSDGRRFIKERQRDGIEKAKAEGTCHGGKRRLDHDKILSLHRQVKARLPSHGQSGAHVCGSTAC